MKQITTVNPSLRKVGTRVHCKKCEKETAFYRARCLECGTAYVKQARGTGRQFTFSDGLRIGRREAALRNDRISYWKQKAEESRKKFEGK